MNGKGILRKKIEELGIADIPEFSIASFYSPSAMKQLFALSNYMHDNKVSILQTHDFYTNVFGMAAGALARVPVRIAAKRETGMRSTAQKFVERRAFNLAHAVVVNANAVKDILTKSGVNPNKITTIYNGLDLQRVEQRETSRTCILRQFGLPDSDNTKFVTIVANMRSPVKNHRMFLRAAGKVKERVPDVGFIIAGEGELTKEIKAFAAELRLAEHVFFTGRCTKVAELLSISEVCVLSSESEGFSNSILEYMAASKPVVATAVGGAAEAIAENENGFLVPADDDEAMADRLIALLENPARAKEMGIRGRKFAEESFSTNAQLAKTLSLYERLSG